jgi:hypothetical protein
MGWGFQRVPQSIVPGNMLFYIIYQFLLCRVRHQSEKKKFLIGFHICGRRIVGISSFEVVVQVRPAFISLFYNFQN